MRASSWNVERTKQASSVFPSLRRVLYWTVLTSLWFTMVSTCTRVTLALDGASDPADQYHNWYTFFVSFSLISMFVSALVVVGTLLVWRYSTRS